MKALLDNGLLRRHRVSKGGLGLRFRINELDAFLKPIMEHAELTDGEIDNLEELSMTCVRAKCSLTKLLELISDRKIWVGRRPDVPASLVCPSRCRKTSDFQYVPPRSFRRFVHQSLTCLAIPKFIGIEKGPQDGGLWR